MEQPVTPKKTDEIKKALQPAVDGIAETLRPVKKALQPAISGISQTLQPLKKALQPAFSSIVESVKVLVATSAGRRISKKRKVISGVRIPLILCAIGFGVAFLLFMGLASSFNDDATENVSKLIRILFAIPAFLYILTAVMFLCNHPKLSLFGSIPLAVPASLFTLFGLILSIYFSGWLVFAVLLLPLLGLVCCTVPLVICAFITRANSKSISIAKQLKKALNKNRVSIVTGLLGIFSLFMPWIRFSGIVSALSMNYIENKYSPFTFYKLEAGEFEFTIAAIISCLLFFFSAILIIIRPKLSLLGSIPQFVLWFGLCVPIYEKIDYGTPTIWPIVMLICSYLLVVLAFVPKRKRRQAQPQLNPQPTEVNSYEA